ncbi:hypothetical protein D3C80_1253410 [compost metagenome]
MNAVSTFADSENTWDIQCRIPFIDLCRVRGCCQCFFCQQGNQLSFERFAGWPCCTIRPGDRGEAAITDQAEIFFIVPGRHLVTKTSGVTILFDGPEQR